MPQLSRPTDDNAPRHLVTATWRRRPLLADPSNAATVCEAVQFLRQNRAFLLAYAVLPDQVHVILIPRLPYTTSRLMQTVKGYSSRIINARVGAGGSIWQRSFFDRLIVGERMLLDEIAYVHQNPVALGLAEHEEDFAFSSAGKAGETDLEMILGGTA